MGIVISLSGVDGSGKSTQAKLLEKYLIGRGKSVLKVQVFSYFILKPLINLLKDNTENTTNIPKLNKNPLLKIWFLFALVDFWFLYIFKIMPIKAKQDFVIADRYFIDLAVALAYYRYMPAWFFDKFIQLLPPSDLTFVLNLPNEIAKKRSSEFSLDYYLYQGNLYKSVCASTEAININASQKLPDVLKEIVSNIENKVNV